MSICKVFLVVPVVGREGLSLYQLNHCLKVYMLMSALHIHRSTPISFQHLFILRWSALVGLCCALPLCYGPQAVLFGCWMLGEGSIPYTPIKVEDQVFIKFFSSLLLGTYKVPYFQLKVFRNYFYVNICSNVPCLLSLVATKIRFK